jgi:hypothetical protein
VSVEARLRPVQRFALHLGAAASLDVRLEPLDTGNGFTINGVVAESLPCEAART